MTIPALISYDGSPRAAFEQMVQLTVANGAASPRTIRAYSQSLGLFFSWAYAHQLEPAKATTLHVQAYRAELVKKHKRGTVKLYLRAVRLFFEAIQRGGKRPDNPAAGVFAPKEATPDEQRILQKALTPKEARQLLGRLPHPGTMAGARDRTIIILMLLQGLRAGEVAQLETGNIEGTFTKITLIGKGSKWRTIVLAPESREAILSWMEYRKVGKSILEHDPLFTALEPSPYHIEHLSGISIRMVERIADKYLQFAGLKRPGRSAHALRHTYAMLAVLGGAEREQVGVSMGHASLATTDIYIRAAANHQANPAEAVRKMLRTGGNENGE